MSKFIKTLKFDGRTIDVYIKDNRITLVENGIETSTCMNNLPSIIQKELLKELSKCGK